MTRFEPRRSVTRRWLVFRKTTWIVWDTVRNAWVDSAWCGNNRVIVQHAADQLNEIYDRQTKMKGIA